MQHDKDLNRSSKRLSKQMVELLKVAENTAAQLAKLVFVVNQNTANLERLRVAFKRQSKK